MERTARTGPLHRPLPRLRLAESNDAVAVRDLVAAAYSHYIPLIGRTPIPMLTDYGEAIRTHDVRVLDDGGVIVGVLELDPRLDHLWLENVAVHPAHQGRGLGTVLLDQAEAVARTLGLPEIRLLTNERYATNIAMYERRGYVETHRRPHLGTDLVFFTKAVDLGGVSRGEVP